MLATPSPTTAALNRGAPLLDWYIMPEAYSAPLVRDAIDEFGVKPEETVLDPFCGTGTTLVASKLAGRHSVGIEVNPFLCFASRVKVRDFPELAILKTETSHLLAEAHTRLGDVEAGRAREYDYRLPDMPRLERWIARRVAVKILALHDCIESSTRGETRDIALLALASILRGASNMKLSPHAFGSREVKQDAPVLAMFEVRLRKMLADIETLYDSEQYGKLGRAEVQEGDIRECTALHLARPAQLAIGSPPYLNNLDYTMQTRLELFFLGFVSNMEDLKRLRKRMMISDAKATYRDVEDWRRVEEVASIKHVAAVIDEKLGGRGWGWDYGRMTRQYFGGLLRAMESIRTMLAPGAPLVLIVGESAHGGVLVAVPDLTAELGRLAGFERAALRVLRTRHSSSHHFSLKESAVILR